MKNSVITSRTKNFLSWAPNSTAEAKLAVVSNQMHSLSFPLKLTVAVKKTEPINQHPHLKMVKQHTQRFTDAVVIVGNVKFSVHKLVLAGKSEFFSELFTKHQNEYRIDDMAENTFKSLLEFMYSNCNPDKVDLALLRGAEQFKLHDLSRYCFSTLQKNISFDNAIEMCTKAEELKLVNFSSKVIEYMAKEPKTVLKSAKWPTMRNHPTVMKKLLYQMKKE
uniref:Speckle-type POZ protein n=2 Tax=Lygus hesperus TaxID=30085 RepID=A0A0A9X4U0_LYGHE